MKCTKCNVIKTRKDFSIRNKETKRLHRSCKKCHSKYRRDHYLVNKDKYIEKAKIQNKKQKEKNSLKICKYLEDKRCIDCGEKNPLTLDFDHVRGNKKFPIPWGYTYSWNTILKEIDKCEIRCANCHRIRHSKLLKSKRYIYFNSKKYTSSQIG